MGFPGCSTKAGQLREPGSNRKALHVFPMGFLAGPRQGGRGAWIQLEDMGPCLPMGSKAALLICSSLDHTTLCCRFLLSLSEMEPSCFYAPLPMQQQTRGKTPPPPVQFQHGKIAAGGGRQEPFLCWSGVPSLFGCSFILFFYKPFPTAAIFWNP